MDRFDKYSYLIERLLIFAVNAHEAVGQRRKYTGTPYFMHPLSVSRIVAKVDHTEAMLAAALLHDTVEDTNATLGDIQGGFGEEVATLVGWLTDISRPEDGSRATRKAIDREHTARAPARAKTIKLADLIDNTESIVLCQLPRPEGHGKYVLLLDCEQRVSVFCHSQVIENQAFAEG